MKVKVVAQKDTDNNFWTIAQTITVGTYRLVVITHNSDSSATITLTEKVTFPSNKVTNTFYYYGNRVVTDSQSRMTSRSPRS